MALISARSQLRQTGERLRQQVGRHCGAVSYSFAKAHTQACIATRIVRQTRMMSGDAIGEQSTQWSLLGGVLRSGRGVIHSTRNLFLVAVLASKEVLLEFAAVFAQIMPETGQVSPLRRTERAGKRSGQIGDATEVLFEGFPLLPGCRWRQRVCIVCHHSIPKKGGGPEIRRVAPLVVQASSGRGGP